jgi:hypothetical protein
MLVKIYRTVILNGYETWSLTLREKRRMRVFENGGVWIMFWAKRGYRGVERTS